MLMKISQIALCASLVLPAIGFLLASPDEIPWLENYAAAVREAKQTGKPLLVEFRCEN